MENINELNSKYYDDDDDDDVAEKISLYPTNASVLSRQSSKRYLRPGVKNLKKHAPRLISKSGRQNVTKTNVSNSWSRYVRDFSNTLVASRWRWTIICLTSSFVCSWLIFAALYMLVANANGQLDTTNAMPCFRGIDAFAGYFLFSLETQATIGYGSRYVTRHCPEAVFLICLQIILGCAICGGIASIVLVKMSKPQLALYSKSLFSKNSVICRRNGELCLMFRVRDNNKHAIGTNITAHLVEHRTDDVEVEPYLKSIALESFGILIWPLEIVHKISDDSSPFWNLCAKDLITKRFELIVTIQGTSSTTSQYSKTVTSYTNTEILWGHRFKQCVFYDTDLGAYCIEHKQFNKTEEILTPLCSAQHLRKVLMDVECFNAAVISRPLLLSPTLHPRALTPNAIATNAVAATDKKRTVVNNPITGLASSENANCAYDRNRFDGDESIDSYLKEIGQRIHTFNDGARNHRRNVARSKSTNDSLIDVECLIENLQKYVDENASV